MAEIAISNLAWQKNEDEEIFHAMKKLKIHYLEISPFRETADISVISDQTAHNLVTSLKKYNIRIIALQALLFRYPHLTLFQDRLTRQKTLNHLIRIINFARDVGAKTLIFGSPKNKRRGEIHYSRAFSLAVTFFQQVAEEAKKNNIHFCIEPTPAIYGADFIRNTNEAIDLIKAVNHSSLKLNVDLGSLHVNNEDPKTIIEQYIEYIGHIHISEPHLHSITLDYKFHKRVAQVINQNFYKGVVSIEMLPQSFHNSEIISKTLTFIADLYKI